MNFKPGDRVLCEAYGCNYEGSLAVGTVKETECTSDSDIVVQVRMQSRSDLRTASRQKIRCVPIPVGTTDEQIRALAAILGKELLL